MYNSELFDLTNDVVLQLGFTGPIGRQFSSVFAETQCTLILGDINEKDGIEIVEKLKKINDKIEYIKIDVTDEKSVKEMIQYLEKKYHKISVLVNAFSKRPTDFNKKFEESTLKCWNDVMEVNLAAVYIICREVSKLMIKQKQGAIINVSSLHGVIAPDQRVYGDSGLNSPIVYMASKSGVIGLTKYLAAYLGKYNIRVNSISPAGVNPGDMDEKFAKSYANEVPMGRMGNMDDMKGPVIFLASKASQFVNGHNLIVDGGRAIW